MAEISNDSKPNSEEVTYREGVQRGSDRDFAAVDRRFTEFGVSLKEFINRAEEKAQVANDALQSLLEANLATILHVTDNTDLLAARLAALTEISELRSEVNRIAIEKAEQAIERRLDALSEFNAASNHNEQNYVTRSMMEVHLDRLSSQTDKMKSTVSTLQSKLWVWSISLILFLLIADYFVARWMH